LRGGRIPLFVTIAAVAAAIFIRLGFWQLHRLGERRARNALVVARLKLPAVDPLSLPRDSAESRFRRARVVGTPDYDHELIYAVRSRNGSPGVNLLTPVRLANTDTAVLVDRGWVYSPDGSTIDLARWHDRDSTFVGFVEPLPSMHGSTYANRATVIAKLSDSVVAKALPYPVLPFFVVALGTTDTSDPANRIARLTVPPLDEGPHLSYAIQWFSFAAVSLIGAGIVIRLARAESSRARGDRVGSDAADGRG
jgi:surfeit locus 1 family protein